MKLSDVFVELQKNSMECFVTPLLPLKESVLSNTLKENPEEGYQCLCEKEATLFVPRWQRCSLIQLWVEVSEARSLEQVEGTGNRKWIGDNVVGPWSFLFSWLFFCNHITVLTHRFYLLQFWRKRFVSFGIFLKNKRKWSVALLH